MPELKLPTEPGLDPPAAPAPPAQRWQRVVLVALAYGVCAKLCLSLGPAAAAAPGELTLWLPLGVFVALRLRWADASMPGLLLATAALLADPTIPWQRLLPLAGGDLAGGWLAVWSLGRAGVSPQLERRGDVGLLLALGLGAALAAAVFAAVLMAAFAQPALAQPRWLLHRTFGHWVGLLLAGVPLMTLRRDAVLRAVAPARRAWTLLLVGAVLCSTLAAVGLSAGLGALLWMLACVPMVLVAALLVHAGLGLASAMTATLAASVLWASGHGFGLFATLPAPQAVASAWIYASMLIGNLLLLHALTRDSLGVERRWLQALDGAGLGAAEWRLGHDEGRASPHWRRLSGIDSASWSAWQSRLDDAARTALQSLLGQLHRGPVSQVRCELRVHGSDGWHWLELQLLVAERNHHGQPVRLIATLSDSSERHDARERQRLSANLFQHLHEGLLIADAQMRVLDVNPAYSQILGVPRSELIGSVPSMLRAAAPDPLVRQQRLLMWAGLRDAGHWRGELVERRRNGEACTLQVTISSVNDSAGTLLNHVLVISDITEQRQQRDRLERQANFDELTRLPNRARLMQVLSQAMAAADADGHLLTVCYLDLDRFKPVNDRLGHAAGDRLLVELAGRLRSALRSNDRWSDAAGRLGGDEFVLLLRAASLEEARLAVERVLRVVALPYVLDPDGEPVHVTASLGATVYPIDRSDADTLLRHADHAMYGAKQAGRNGHQFFDPENRRRNEERVMAIGRVHEALDKSELTLHYQPKVDMRRGVVLGLEALLRWDHPQHGLIAPMQFLPLIENTGLSSRVGDWVLSQALEHLSAWRRAGLDISVSVNVSARHLQEPDFAQRLSELLARHPDTPATALELEVLETAAHADIEATSALLSRCREIGVRFALDDFGTGYSTLTYLKQLPVDVLKIDRSFVHHMLDDAQDRAIVEGVIGLARTFQCAVVAEGVESPAQARALLEMGCDIGQGTGIAAPMPAAAVPGWVREHRGLFALAAAAPPAASRTAAS
jgi:diguanylate cyclase (GGDEF)-like protein/PAS domain S-box-containing protein